MVTNFRGLNENDTLVGFKVHGHSIFLHNSYRKLLSHGYCNSWFGLSTKTTKISTPRKLSHLNLINLIYVVCISLDLSMLIFLLVYLALCWIKVCTYIWLFSSFPARAIRDSGYSSGDPSPNNSVFQDSPTNSHLAALQCKRYQRSNSTPSPQAVRTSKKKIKRPSRHTLSSVILSLDEISVETCASWGYLGVPLCHITVKGQILVVVLILLCLRLTIFPRN